MLGLNRANQTLGGIETELKCGDRLLMAGCEWPVVNGRWRSAALSASVRWPVVKGPWRSAALSAACRRSNAGSL